MSPLVATTEFQPAVGLPHPVAQPPSLLQVWQQFIDPKLTQLLQMLGSQSVARNLALAQVRLRAGLASPIGLLCQLQQTGAPLPDLGTVLAAGLDLPARVDPREADVVRAAGLPAGGRRVQRLPLQVVSTKAACPPRRRRSACRPAPHARRLPRPQLLRGGVAQRAGADGQGLGVGRGARGPKRREPGL